LRPPPERQERARNLYRRFSSSAMPPEERQARFQSDEFQGKF